MDPTGEKTDLSSFSSTPSEVPPSVSKKEQQLGQVVSQTLSHSPSDEKVDLSGVTKITGTAQVNVAEGEGVQQKEIEELKGQAATQEKEIEELKGQASTQEKEIEELKGQAATQEKEIEELKKEQEKEVTKLKKEIQDQRKITTQLETEIKQLMDEKWKGKMKLAYYEKDQGKDKKPWKKIEGWHQQWNKSGIPEQAKKTKSGILFKANYWSTDLQRRKFLEEHPDPTMSDFIGFVDELKPPHNDSSNKRKRGETPEDNQQEFMKQLETKLGSDPAIEKQFFPRAWQTSSQVFDYIKNSKNEQVKKFGEMVSTFEIKELTILREVIKKIDPSIDALCNTVHLVNSGNTNNSDLIALCVVNDINCHDKFIASVKESKVSNIEIVKICNLLQGEVHPKKVFEEIIAKIESWENLSDENAFLIIEELIKYYKKHVNNNFDSVGDFIELISEKELNKSDLIKDPIKKSVYAEHLILKKNEASADEVQKIIAACDGLLNEENFLCNTVYSKHVAKNEQQARVIAEERFPDQRKNISEASVLIGDEELFKRGAILALRARSAFIQQKLESPFDRRQGGRYEEYIFPDDHPFSEEIKSVEYLHMTKSGAATSSYTLCQWRGVQFNLAQQNGLLTVTHCSPISSEQY